MSVRHVISTVLRAKSIHLLPKFTSSPNACCSLQISRNYDKVRYKALKNLEKAKKNQDDITFNQALAIFKPYCFDSDVIIKAHIELDVSDEINKIRGDINLPKTAGLVGSSSGDTILGKQAEIAKQNGAHIIGGEELIPQVCRM
ncbi:hypothetical protein HK096_003348 [Nowakowskiella sp. JEL0078]|nr:hypothetical protein HK096_003348 [Nowakowskiella sp. JEL0078]